MLSRKVYGKRLVYLDSAATAQKPSGVLEKTDALLRNVNSNVHRGVHCLSIESTEEYEAARETVRGFINAADKNEIIFTSGATAAINTVAYSFAEAFVGKGDNIVVSEMEHHSNIVPWQIVCERKGAAIRVLPFGDDGRLKVEALGSLLDERTRLIAVTQASNVLGTRPDIKRIIGQAHSVNIPVLVDGCQGIVHGGADVQELGCDFYAFSGHKLYGPTGTGVLYGRSELLERMPPFMGGGDMVDTVSFPKTTYAGLPLKFEAGTANYIGAAGLAEAIRYLGTFGHGDIAAHEDNLLAYATDALLSLKGVRVYGECPDKCSIISFTAKGTHPTDIGMILDKMGIAVRTGHHCAEPVMSHYGITGMCRASFAMYNTLEEADLFVQGVDKALSMLR